MSYKKLKIEKVGAQILREISEQVYGDLYKQIREIVSNSFDAGATELKIRINNDFDEIVFEDNGKGMSADDIENHFVSLAISDQGNNPETIGRKGVGKFSLLGISRNFVMETRKEGSDGRLSEDIVRVSFSFVEACEMENSGLPLDAFDVGRLQLIPAPLTENHSFTRITCKSIQDHVTNILKDHNEFEILIKKLRKVLPLRYDPNHPVIKKLEPSTRERLLKTKVPVIDVYIKSPHDPEGQGRKLTRILWGENPVEQPMRDRPIEFCHPIGENITVYGYIIATVKKIEQFWNGLVVRVKNVAVEERSFFDYHDTPVKNRLTGEVNIDGIDDLSSITMDRSSFNRTNDDYKKIEKVMTDSLKEIGDVVRGRSNMHGKFKRASQFCEGFQDAKSSIQNSFNAIVNERLDSDNYNNEFTHAAEDFLVDQFKVRDPGVKLMEIREESQIDEFQMTTAGNEVRVAVPTKILDTATYLGTHDRDELDLWKYRFLKGAPSEPPCVIHLEEKEIILNTGHNAVKVGDCESIKIIVLLTMSYLKYGHDATLMYEKLMSLLTFDDPAPTSFDV